MKGPGEKSRKEPSEPGYRLRREQLEQVRQRLTTNQLQDGDREIIDHALTVLVVVLGRLESAKIGIKRLRNLLFGPRTEKEKRPPQDPPVSEDRTGGERTGVSGSPRTALAPGTPEAEAGSESQNQEPFQEKKKVRGHGRKPASAYINAEVVPCPLCGLVQGDRCPACGRGRMRPLAPVVEIRLIGNPPVSAKRYEQERLRCNTCGNTVTAELPPEAGPRKSTPSAQASVAVLKYSGGMAFNRLNLLEQYQGVPLPASTQWEMVEEAADTLFPLYRELHRQAAGGNLLFIDDTRALILALGKPRADNPKDRGRQGVFTTGILSRIGEQWVALYLSGPRHAGENVRQLLALRPGDLPPPIQMSDALSRNLLPGQLVVLVLCLVHSRRNFFEIRDFYPEVCQQVLETIKTVYKHEASIQEQGLSPTQRLAYHRANASKFSPIEPGGDNRCPSPP